MYNNQKHKGQGGSALYFFAFIHIFFFFLDKKQIQNREKHFYRLMKIVQPHAMRIYIFFFLLYLTTFSKWLTFSSAKPKEIDFQLVSMVKTLYFVDKKMKKMFGMVVEF